MMFIDTHMHCLEGSPDSFIKVAEIVARARELGLDGICITDHDSNSARAYALEYGQAHDFKIFVGVEILTYEGDIVVFGLDDLPTEKMHAQELIDLVNAKGGVTIAAHPFRENNRGCGKVLKELKGLTAVEVFNGSTKAYNNLYAFATAVELGLATVAASDCHEVETVGRYCTGFVDAIETEADLIAAIKQKRVYPAVHRDGRYIKIDAYGKYGQIIEAGETNK
ncbi:MAG: PHP-associated domain-containing protein [Cellulosilyticaceae bacterium]